MEDLIVSIHQATETEIESLLNAVLDRYTMLYPQWEINIISLRKNEDRNEQLDRIINLLQKMKTFP